MPPVARPTPTLAERDRARLFYQAFLNSSNAIEITDREGILVDVNPAFERIYGYSRSEVIGQKPRIVRSPKTSAGLYERLWKDLLDPGKGQWSGELTNVDRMGREHPVLLTISAVRDPSGPITHFMGVATDLTEFKQLQAQTIHAERLASLGEMATGVAHELNTPLASILLLAESIERRASDPQLADKARTIGRQVRSASRIVTALLNFGRAHPKQIEKLALSELLAETVDFSRGVHPGKVNLVLQRPVGDLRVEGDRTQLQQVFVNLINNAYDATGKSGEIVVSGKESDGWAEVRITDSGPGVPPEAVPRLFEPFFTTKPPGTGTGLGLAICATIVSAHRGRIEFQSGPNRGATFTVKIPLHSGAPE